LFFNNSENKWRTSSIPTLLHSSQQLINSQKNVMNAIFSHRMRISKFGTMEIILIDQQNCQVFRQAIIL